MTFTGLSRAVARVSGIVLYGVIPAVAALLFLTSRAHGEFGFDFRGTLWNAAGDLLEGRNPYPDPSSATLRSGNPAVYPPFSMFAVAPLRALGWHAGFAVWVTLLVAATVMAFYLLGIRDWRIYTLVVLSVPVMTGAILGNLTLLLLLAVGICWRYRDRPGIAGAAIGAAVAAKLFLWPLLVWLLITRRYRAAGVAAVWGATLVVVPWALVGFRGFLEYPRLLHAVAEFYGPRSASLVALGEGLGLGRTAGTLPWVAGLVILAAAGLKASENCVGSEPKVFALCVLAAVAASPLVWAYTVATLFVAITLLWPRPAVVGGFAVAVWFVESPGAFTYLGFTDQVAAAAPVFLLVGGIAALALLDRGPAGGSDGAV